MDGSQQRRGRLFITLRIAGIRKYFMIWESEFRARVAKRFDEVYMINGTDREDRSEVGYSELSKLSTTELDKLPRGS
jgi:hypothetical protein